MYSTRSPHYLGIENRKRVSNWIFPLIFNKKFDDITKVVGHDWLLAEFKFMNVVALVIENGGR